MEGVEARQIVRGAENITRTGHRWRRGKEAVVTEGMKLLVFNSSYILSSLKLCLRHLQARAPQKPGVAERLCAYPTSPLAKNSTLLLSSNPRRLRSEICRQGDLTLHRQRKGSSAIMQDRIARTLCSNMPEHPTDAYAGLLTRFLDWYDWVRRIGSPSRMNESDRGPTVG